MSTLERPLPVLNDANGPYWESARERRLRLPQCSKCSRYFYPLTPRCPSCLSAELRWQEVSGRGTLVTWNVMHQVYDKAFADLAPYVVGVVQLAEGPKVISNIVDCDPAVLRTGLPLQLSYLEVNDEVTLPVYYPTEQQS